MSTRILEAVIYRLFSAACFWDVLICITTKISPTPRIAMRPTVTHPSTPLDGCDMSLCLRVVFYSLGWTILYYIALKLWKVLVLYMRRPRIPGNRII